MRPSILVLALGCVSVCGVVACVDEDDGGAAASGAAGFAGSGASAGNGAGTAGVAGSLAGGSGTAGAGGGTAAGAGGSSAGSGTAGAPAGAAGAPAGAAGMGGAACLPDEGGAAGAVGIGPETPPAGASCAQEGFELCTVGVPLSNLHTLSRCEGGMWKVIEPTSTCTSPFQSCNLPWVKAGVCCDVPRYCKNLGLLCDGHAWSALP